MGVTKEIKETRRSSNGKKPPQQKKWPNSVTFHPTAEERASLNRSPADPQKDLEWIETFLERGCSLTIGVRIDSDSFYATIRQRTLDWMTAPAITAWHTTPAGALQGLAFALGERYGDFPEMGTRQLSFIDEW